MLATVVSTLLADHLFKKVSENSFLCLINN